MRNCSRIVSMVLTLIGGAVMAFAGGGEQTKLNTAVRTESITVRPPVRFEFSRTVGRGRLVRTGTGSPGIVRRTYRVTTKRGKVVAKELLKEERREAVPIVFQMGQYGFTASRGSYVRHKVLTMSATGYDASPATIGRGATGRTRTGRIAEYGVVAVDPRVIPLNTIVYVEGYGFALACDTGSAIKGHRIDLCYDDRSSALRFGRRQVKVHVLQ